LELLKKLIPPAIFLLFVLVAVEISFRIYTAGVAAVDPRRMHSMNTLMRSEFVQLSEYPDVFFELKPDMDGWFRGVPFATNSRGLVDQEYSLQKPEGTRRIVVTGSSWTMPAGVKEADAWHAVLERQLNEGQPEQPVEVVNFGVEMYGLREIIATIRRKALQWEPDLIVAAVTPYTGTIVWEPEDQPQYLPERAYPGFESYTLAALRSMLGLPGKAPKNDRRRHSGGDQAVLEQLQRALDELSLLQSETKVPAVMLFLGYFPLEKFDATLREYADEKGVKLLHGNRIFPLDAEERNEYQISNFDRHPNERGHQAIADFVAEEVRTRSLLESAD